MFTRLSAVVLFTLSSLCTSTVASTSTAAQPSHSRSTDPGALALTTERVIVFKDGYGLFVKAATGVADAQGTVHTEQVPGAAVLGTFWAVAEERPLRSTIASWHEAVRPKKDEGACLSTLEVLRANEGKQVTLGLGDGELVGKLVDVLEAPALRPKLVPDGEGTYEADLAPRGGELLAVDVPDKGRLVMPVASVKTVLGKELSTHCVRPGEVATRTKRLTFDFGRDTAGKRVSLKLFYFTPGVRWIPTYRVDTGPSSRAELSLQAEILNEEENFDAAAVDLVVGVGSFRFKDTVSPMALERTLRSALMQAMPALMNSNRVMSNANFNSRAGERFAEGDVPAQPSVMGFAAELGAESRQDLFVYSVKSLGLKKGARAMVPLWRKRAPQRHVYTVDLGAPSRTASDSSPLKLAENKVWHQLELTDDTDVPFTTGAALLMEAGVPLGQELLGYTPPGGTTMIPMTIALNLRATHSEREVSRTAGSLTVHSTSYALLKKKGTIELSNHQKERATMRVSLATAGKIESANRGGKIVLDELDRVNNHSRVGWEVSLAAGEAVTLSYELAVYR